MPVARIQTKNFLLPSASVWFGFFFYNIISCVFVRSTAITLEASVLYISLRHTNQSSIWPELKETTFHSKHTASSNGRLKENKREKKKREEESINHIFCETTKIDVWLEVEWADKMNEARLYFVFRTELMLRQSFFFLFSFPFLRFFFPSRKITGFRKLV